MVDHQASLQNDTITISDDAHGNKREETALKAAGGKVQILRPPYRRKNVSLKLICFGVILCFMQLFASKDRLSIWLVNVDSERTLTRGQEMGSRRLLRDYYAFTDEDMHIIEDRRSCYVLENICRSSESYRWFYYQQEGTSTSNSTSRRRQPDVSLVQSRWGGKLRMSVNQSSYYSEHNRNESSGCQISPVPNHMVLTGNYISMIAEFYPRVVAGLWKLRNDLSTPWWKSSPRTEHIQFYVQVQGQNGGDLPELLSSMHPMMKAFSANPLLHIKDLFNDTTGDNTSSECLCYPRLIFCGYGDALDEKREKAKKALNKKKIKLPNETIPEYLLKTKRLKPSSEIKPEPKNEYHKVQVHTRDGALLSYTDMGEKISNYRRDAVLNAMALGTNVSVAQVERENLSKLDEWTVIGFSQRGGRRRWLNLDEVLEMCYHEWLPYKIACVVVNLDTEFGRVPENQVTMHGGLDALIGIHGSQNVHGIWLPDRASILEILPFLGPAGNGAWGATTHKTTINGRFFRKTKYLHAGYPLDASSVPDCKKNYPGVKGCYDGPRWANRDFLVPSDVIDSFVRKFMIRSNATHPLTVRTAPLRPCEEFEQLAQKEFVLYNVHCQPRPLEYHRSFFRNRDTFAHLNQSPERAPKHKWIKETTKK